MEKPLFSPSWYRIARLKPRLRAHSQIHRHTYRGEQWYVLQDHVSSRLYRFTPTAYQIIGLMDGSRTVQELWELAAERLGDDSPTQDDMIRLFRQLHMADVLLCDEPPDTRELLKRSKTADQARWKANLRSPLFLRFSLFDPDIFLARTLSFIKPLFGLFGLVLWLTATITATVLAGRHWPELTHNIADRVLAADNLLILWFVYPVVKILHEFGHGYAVKRWDGEVHEMGIMLLVLMPLPYVDASAASAFREKWRRILVGGAGILTELFVASLAMLFWVSLAPGLPRSIAFNVILVGSVSTLLFNANPLLRYDGYYMLADLLDIPNLAQRSINYLQYSVKKYLLKIPNTERPYIAPGERPWLAVYAVAAFFYRLFIYVGIILFIAGKFFIIGILLAIWAAGNMFALPLFKGVRFILANRSLHGRRLHAITVTGGSLAFVLLLLCVLPFPLWTNAEGVVWAPEDAMVRAGAGGFLQKLTVPGGSPVQKGQILANSSDPELEAQTKILRARLNEFELRYGAALATDPLKANIILEEREHIRTALGRAEEELADLTVRSPRDGLFVVPKEADLAGRFLRKGELIGYVLEAEKPVIRVVVPQTRVDLIRQRTTGVLLRFADHFDTIVPATVKREVPGGMEQLPSPTLSTAGGGQIAIDPTEQNNMKTFEKMFQFDIEIAQPRPALFLGGRVYTRFQHGYEPLALQWYRLLRQLFLKRFNV